jgi:hypothetical protein
MHAKIFLSMIYFLAVTSLQLHAAPVPPAILEIGSRKQLFIDDYIIQSLTDARQVLNRATKVANNPVVRPEHPWEGDLNWIEKVLYDKEDGLFKMWYSTSSDWKAEPGGEMSDYHWTDKGAVRKVIESAHRYAGDHRKYVSRRCYATSRDGVHWKKPQLGLVEFNGSRSNNLLPAGSRVPSFLDTNERDPAKRYKAIEQVYSPRHFSALEGMQLHLYYSGDGFQWIAEADNPVMDTTPEPGRWGPTYYMGWDPIRQVYAVHMENCLHRGCPHGKRIVGRAESPDLRRWSVPQNILLPDERDPIDAEFYGFPTITYERTYIALAWIFRTTNTLHYPTLAFSRNGVHYERKFREPLVPPGDHGSFDEVSIFAHEPIMHDGKVWIYYTGANWRGPEQLYLKKDEALRAAGLATLPEDGFVSIDAGKVLPGIVLTRVFSFSGSRLTVNIESARHNDGAGRAEVKVEILDHQARPISGFSLDQSDPLTGSGKLEASWQGHSDLSALAGRPVQLRFWIRNAKLYSFQFK